MTSTSDLAALVDAEASLDAKLATARDTANRARAAARQLAADAMAAIDGELARERTRIADEIATATAVELRAIADDARARIAAYDALRGDALVALARELADELVAMLEEPP